MKMKEHILAAMREVMAEWEDLLSGLDDEQALVPLLPSRWTVKDVMAHLMAWQQRSTARVEAALQGREPQFPAWPADLHLDAAGGTDRANAWLYEHYRGQPWTQAREDWRKGFRRLLDAAAQIPEPQFLDGNRHAWLGGHAVADVLLWSYDHHQEHLEALQIWLREHGTAEDAA